MASPAVLPFGATPTPRKIWIELTSKCPFDCVFCSRKTLRGSGQHMPFELYRSLLAQLCDPRAIMLNYSGESTVYPELIPAIRAARSTGALVELVSALASAPESMLPALTASGLSRLTVSLHAADPEAYFEIYRYSSFETLRARLEKLTSLARGAPDAPAIDFAFVAMDGNLRQLEGVAAFAESLEIREVAIFPVLRRDEIPAPFSAELTSNGEPRPEFRRRVQAAVEEARTAHPEMHFSITHPGYTANSCAFGRVPMPFPAPLPPEGRIHSCEQNPWETAHVLANGDVVACEVLDKIALGNVGRQSLEQVWHGPAYSEFRERYQRGEIPECRVCPWKTVYRNGSPMESEILARYGRHAQLLTGWHEPLDEPHVWSSQHAEAVIEPRPQSRSIHVRGALPPGPLGEPNELRVECNGHAIGRIMNVTRETIEFGEDFPVAVPSAGPWRIGFHTGRMYRPSEHRAGADQRDLGFALVFLSSNRFVDPDLTTRHRRQLRPLASAIRRIDWLGMRMRPFRRRQFVPRVMPVAAGLSIVIPERDHPEELEKCLGSALDAARPLRAPLQMIVVVNGSPASGYSALTRAFPAVEWQFHRQGLDFASAVSVGLRRAVHDWVYLLNNDVTLDPGALAALAEHRDPSTFAVASQIVLRDTTRHRDETNWGALLLEDGLATIHDWIPRSDAQVETFYAGGGASLFQTRLLGRLLAKRVYAPFYWEDVEWGWRARKLGYRSIFCPRSVAWHGQHTTVRQRYSPEDVENVTERNRLLFQLRNFTSAGSLDRVFHALARAPESVTRRFTSRRGLWEIAQGRLWNHLAPVSDEEVFASWHKALPSGATD